MSYDNVSIQCSLPGCWTCAYLRHRLRCPPFCTHRIDAQLAPHELCRQPFLPLFQLIDVVSITSIMARCHQLSPDIAGDFREYVPWWTLSSPPSVSEPSIWQAIIFIIVCRRTTDQSVRLKDPSEAVGTQ